MRASLLFVCCHCCRVACFWLLRACCCCCCCTLEFFGMLPIYICCRLCHAVCIFCMVAPAPLPPAGCMCCYAMHFLRCAACRCADLHGKAGRWQCRAWLLQWRLCLCRNFLHRFYCNVLPLHWCICALLRLQLHCCCSTAFFCLLRCYHCFSCGCFSIADLCHFFCCCGAWLQAALRLGDFGEVYLLGALCSRVGHRSPYSQIIKDACAIIHGEFVACFFLCHCPRVPLLR